MTNSTNTSDKPNASRLPRWVLAILPLAILAVLIWAFVQFNPIASLTGEVPPIEELSIQRFDLSSEGIVAHVVNGGPDPITIAQVLVDDAYWAFDIAPPGTIPRLGRATVSIPYPWVEGEAHEIVFLTNTGITFDGTIEVALETPVPDLNYWLTFAWIGVFVGIIPVGLGLMWLPLLGQLGRRGLNFVLALTVGLLVFLLVDMALEGVEIAEQIPEVFQAIPMFVFAGLLSFMALVAVGRQKGVSGANTRSAHVWLASTIALGIGFHNLGEGMAIGAAVALGEAALGSFLVIGFMLHNITEGIGIGAPIARDKPRLRLLVGLTLLAGGPAVLGTWIGGFAFSPFWAVFFLAIGAGAILQVIYEVTRLLLANAPERETAFSWVNIAGLTTGIAIMYFTALLVKF